jgi:CBS domain-containing protein
LNPDETLRSAIEKMHSSRVSCIVVTEDKKPVGILTERDVIQFIGDNIDLNTTKLMTVMKGPIIAVSEEIEIPEAANIMAAKGLRRLVIVDKENVITGIVTQTDIIRNMSIDSFISLKKVEQKKS